MKMAVPLLVVTSVVVCIAAVLVAAFLIDPPTTTSSSAAVAFSSFAAFCRATGHHLSALMGQMQPFNGHSPSPKENQQLQVHISLAGPYKIKVSWITFDAAAISRVDYGTLPGIYDKFGEGTNGFYTFAFYKSGYVHDVIIGPLEANTVYYYKCGGNSQEYSFKTPPPLGPEVPIMFAVAGDLGQTKWTSSTLDHIQQSNHDVLILPGDLSYADYYQPLWDSFGRLVEPLASSRPWMVTEGNHEVERLPFLIDAFKAYNTRWKMPYKESGSDSNLYYSFDVAGVHVLMLGSYTDFGQGSNQFKWLQADLAKLDRTSTPWLIAIIHAPWYSSNSKHQGDGEEMRKSMELTLRDAHVDLVFAGHVHAYERTAKVFDWKVDHDCGIYYITIGDGGNREGLARTFLDPTPDWSVYREASFGHGILKVLNSTHAHWIWHRNQDNYSVVGDELWLTKTIGARPSCGSSVTG